MLMNACLPTSTNSAAGRHLLERVGQLHGFVEATQDQQREEGDQEQGEPAGRTPPPPPSRRSRCARRAPGASGSPRPARARTRPPAAIASRGAVDLVGVGGLVVAEELVHPAGDVVEDEIGAAQPAIADAAHAHDPAHRHAGHPERGAEGDGDQDRLADVRLRSAAAPPTTT